MADKANLKEVEAFLKVHRDVTTVDMMVVDMNGILRGKQLGRDYVTKLYTEGVRLPGSNYLLDWTGQNVSAYEYGTSDGDPDYFCKAAPGTLKPVPWARRSAGQVIASMEDAEGQPHFADPRHILKRVVERLADIGLTPVIAIEYEFYLVNQDETSKERIVPARSPQTNWRASTVNVYGLDDVYDFADLLGEVHDACAMQDIPAETIISEYAAGQFEINLHHSSDALRACDQAIMLEHCIKQVARKHGTIATFMAKPFAESAGSGLHVHVSLLDENGRNVMAGEMDKRIERPISDTLRHAVGGLLATMPESMAIFAPNANSYRRLRPGTYAPVKGIWGGDNRTLPLRVPGGDAKSARIEHRVSGADANPYLVVAAVLAGMHHGITNKLTPPQATVGDGYAQEDGIDLPVRWPLALQALQDGKILPGYLGEKWLECFHTARSSECDNHHYTIHALDYEWYLRTA